MQAGQPRKGPSREPAGNGAAVSFLLVGTVPELLGHGSAPATPPTQGGQRSGLELRV